MHDPSGQYLSAGHGFGADDASGQYDPGGHTMDLVGVGQYRPMGHGSHDFLPEHDTKVPAGHSVGSHMPGWSHL